MSESILQKVKKLLALSHSSEPHEAALALERARELMERYKITATQVEASEVRHETIRRNRKVYKPYDSVLLSVIKNVFSVDILFVSEKQYLCIVGEGVSVELAKFALEVTSRQLEKDRSTFISTLSNRLKKQSKVKRGDEFAFGWVIAVESKLAHLTSAFPTEKLNAWLQSKGFSGDLKNVKPKKTTIKPNSEAVSKGYKTGLNVDIRKPLGSNQEPNYLLGL